MTTCKQRVDAAMKSRINDIRKMYELECNNEPEDEDLGALNDYGLCLDFVEAGTFYDQTEAYIRYQISWGGPSEEFRIFEDGRIEFWFLDWGDGASIELNEEDNDLICNIIIEPYGSWNDAKEALEV